MRNPFPSLGSRYAVAVTSVAAAAGLTMLAPALERLPTALFFAAVMAAAWYGGLGPGLVATVLSVAALDYFFIPPIYTLGVGVADGARLGVFLLVAVLISSLNAARLRLQEELRRQGRHKDNFLAVLGHELRTPLAAAANALHILRIQETDALPASSARAILERQVRQLTRLIDDVLDVARIGQGKVRLCKTAVDLSGVATRAVEAVRPLLDARRHRLEVVLPARPMRLEADPARLEQVVVNLLTNAAKYTPPGGRIGLTVEAAAGEARLRVRDDGAGLAPELLPRLFHLFTQAESGSQGGLGIGLHLVHTLVRLHGGTVTAASAGPGQGSEFVIRLPLALEEGSPDGEGRRERLRAISQDP